MAGGALQHSGCLIACVCEALRAVYAGCLARGRLRVGSQQRSSPSPPQLTLVPSQTSPNCCLQGGAVVGGAAAAAAAEAVREKEVKINELIEELGNKELLLSEAQGQLAAVSGGGCAGNVGWAGVWGVVCGVSQGARGCCSARHRDSWQW